MCWGYGANGRLGYGNANNVGDYQTPGSVGPVNLGLGHTAVAISAGADHTCVILNDGSVRCWGFGFDGQLGYGNQNNAGDTPTDTPDMLAPVNSDPDAPRSRSAPERTTPARFSITAACSAGGTAPTASSGTATRPTSAIPRPTPQG